MPHKRQKNARPNLRTGGGEDHTTLSLRDHGILSVNFSSATSASFVFYEVFGNIRGDLLFYEALQDLVKLYSLLLTNSSGIDASDERVDLQKMVLDRL